MKRNIVFLLLALISFGFIANDTQKTLEEINARFKNVEVSVVRWPTELYEQLDGLKDTAFVALPKKQTAKKLPLLITLHGAGGKTWTIQEQLKRSSRVKGLSLAENAAKQLMLVEPNSYESWNPKTLNIMLDYLLETYPQIDTTRIYLMGHSMDGRGTYDWICAFPERFAAAAPCGFSGVTTEDDINSIANMPIWAMVGGDDSKNVGSVKTLTDLLLEAGNKNVRYTEFPGANHAQGNAAVFSATECVEWMLSLSK